jgi:DNA helicase II / ATP-dependent DNA helicase PcrA
MNDILHGLNKAQRDAVTSDAAVLQVLAPPGSGKTKTLTARVAYLIKHRGLKPWNIITCTFTKKAATEMKERIRSFVGEQTAKDIRLGTFHAIAAQYLRQYGQHIEIPKDFGIADTSDSRAILKRIIKKHDLTSDPKKALARISANKSKGITSDQFTRTANDAEKQEFAQLFTMYEDELKGCNLLDYDDLLLRCCFLMRNHRQCVSNVEAVLIDEFQDTNTIQYDLMALFAQARNTITIVGDPDQSIYGWRNAEIKNLKLMKDRWSDTLTINLEENYRSSAAILNAAQKLIEQDDSRPAKKLRATHGHGLRPVLRKLPSSAGEAAWIVSEIKRMHTLSANSLQHDDFAILLRTQSLSRVVETALGKEGVPYRMVGVRKFFDRAEIKLVIDYLRVINDPSNNEALEHVINVPSRRIGDATVKSLREEATKAEVSCWNLIREFAQGNRKLKTKIPADTEKGMKTFVGVILKGRNKLLGASSEQAATPVDLIKHVVKATRLDEYIKHKYENEAEARWSNIEELEALAQDAVDTGKLETAMAEELLPSIEGIEQRLIDSGDMLSVFLSNIALSTAGPDKPSEDNKPVPQITISTIHSAKGLEWPVVFIPACYQGSIPHSRAEDNDEERRLLYVGMTRAQAMLYLSCPIKDTQKNETSMSSFLTQPGVDSFFEEHGPSMSFGAVQGLATTLRREEPQASVFVEMKQTLERDQDNYWPLNGEEPAEEKAKWEYGKSSNPQPVFGNRSASWANPTSMTMHQQEGGSCTSTSKFPGFASVTERYDDLLEEEKMKALEKRKKTETADAPKGRKRQIEGQGTITGFMNKRQATSIAVDNSSGRPVPSTNRSSSDMGPLRDISNLEQCQTVSSLLSTRATTTDLYKPRTAPLPRPSRPAPSSPKPKDGYMFLSSSPTKPDDEENDVAEAPTEQTAEDALEEGPLPTFKPASTFHTTSMQNVQRTKSAPGRRYGVKPSFNGWQNRAHK